MTTFKNNLNKQLFQELDDRIAANLNGGTVSLYENDLDISNGGRRLDFNYGTDNLTAPIYNFNDLTSSIKITGDKNWNFYRDINRQSYLTTLEPGEYDLKDLEERGIPNDSISSLRISTT
jgi:hypothetical protein